MVTYARAPANLCFRCSHTLSKSGAWRARDGRDHGVPRLLERQPERRGELAEDRPGLVVKEQAARSQHRGDVRRRQRQLLVVEIRKDVGGNHQVERCP